MSIEINLCRVLAMAVWFTVAGPAAAQTLRLAVSSGPVSLPVYVAAAEGYFAREGIEVKLQECDSGRACVQQLREGQADLATAAELVVVRAAQALIQADPSIAIIATLSSSTRHIKLVARGDAGIATASDLRGKQIASVSGTSAQYFLDSWLVFHDIDPTEVKLQSRPPADLVRALARNEVDAIAIWEPVASQAIADLAGRAVVLNSPRIYTQHFNLVAGRPLIAQRETDLRRLLRALERAQRFIAERPAQAREILTARLGSNGGVDLMAEHDFRLKLDQTLVATMEAQVRWAARQDAGQTARVTVDVLGLIETSLLGKTVPGAVELAPRPVR